MAKKDKTDAANTSNPSGKSKNKKKKKGKLLPIMIILLFLIGGSIAAIVIFNPLDIRDTYLANIPVIGEILVPSPEVLEERAEARTNAQLLQELEELNMQLEILTDDLAQVRSINQMYSQEISTLREIEDQQIQFRAERAEFDRMIAEGDAPAFVDFFQTMSPENAEAIYRELIVQVAQTEELDDWVRTVVSMEDDAAASMLEAMISSEMDLVVIILDNIAANRRGAILSEMSPANAADVFPRMAPYHIVE